MRVDVRYVNGQEISATPSGWPVVRGDGLDYVDLRNGRQAYRIQGRSLYWLYREDGLWVVGGGTVTGIEESVAESGGGFEVRHPQHMPDLTANQIKLGWWER